MSRKRKIPVDVWEDTIVEPVTGTVDHKKQEKRFRRFNRLLRVNLYLLPIVLILTISALTATNQPAVTSGRVDQFGGVAQAYVANWVEQQPDLFSHVVTWDGGELTPSGAAETHQFTIQNVDGLLSKVAVVVGASREGAPTVIGAPTLLGVLQPAADWSLGGSLLWGLDTPTQGASEALQLSVLNWAKALLGDEPGQLRLEVGDENPDNHYEPLSMGVQDVDVMVGVVKLLTQDGSEALAETVIRAGGDPLLSFDVLISGVNSGSPKVRAWGAVGSGMFLAPFSNAVPGKVS